MSDRNGCGVSFWERSPSTSVFGSEKLMWIRSRLVPGVNWIVPFSPASFSSFRMAGSTWRFQA